MSCTKNPTCKVNTFTHSALLEHKFPFSILLVLRPRCQAPLISKRSNVLNKPYKLVTHITKDPTPCGRIGPENGTCQLQLLTQFRYRSQGFQKIFGHAAENDFQVQNRRWRFVRLRASAAGALQISKPIILFHVLV